MSEMGAGASTTSGQDSPSPNSILSSQVARQRTTSATANSNSGTSLPSSTGNSNVAAQANSLINQSPSSTSLFHHRSNVSPFSSPVNVQTTVNSSSYVLDMPTGESSSQLLAAGERIPSQRIEHHGALMNAITSGDANQQRDGIDTSDRIDFSSSTAARRVADRLSRLPNPGALSRNYRIRYPHQDEERGEDTNEESNRQNQRSNRDDGGSSPMGFISQLIHQNPELSGVVKACEKYIPFVLIAVAKGFFDHATGIFVFVALIVTFFHANSVITREVSRHARRNVWPLVAVLVNLMACIVFIHFVFEDAKLYLLTIFLPSGKVESFSELLWIVAVNDFILKFVAVIFKILIVMLPGNLLPHRKRGNCFLFIEMSSQMHRSLVPIQVWLTYLLQGGLPGASTEKRIPSKVIGVILTAMYMVIKGKLILKDAMSWKIAASRFWQNIQYGMNPTTDDLKTCGGICPICHDSLQDATMLHCKHIFCEECVATWFDRERTCPMCRAQITEDPAWRDGSTSQFIQLF